MADYIQNLRKIVGTQPLMQCGATVGDEVYNIDVVYYTSFYHGGIEINEESSEYAFFAILEIPDDVSPPQRPIVEYLKTNSPLDKLHI